MINDERIKELVDIAHKGSIIRLCNSQIVARLYEIDKTLAEEYRTLMNW